MPPHGEASKLFKVLVLGGLSMAIPACSGGAAPGDDAGGGGDAAADVAAKDQSAPPADAAADADDGGMCVQIHCPDCGSGVCGW